ncbi:hypothetical protein [Devosia sp. FJ2-5-3]|jgi:hypothetical protein|uniref:hypothetical protein n=1 Tax=Devosia sp. FJ2-5-3 TaxID=2976680 RepID=UPI0023D82CE3|nr:hypothetical protein [Devosia sp. FJ2-5-3]WEJ58988.1 hypothetical protein N0P34_02840 [Devosia sp. FJ2-5-3]
MSFARLLSIFALGSAALAGPAIAESGNEQNVFVMGGPFTSGYFSDAFLVWEDHYESNFFAGVGYQYFMYEHSGGFKLGAEAGLGVRVGDRSSAELWAGLVGRVDMFQFGDIRITPSITAGFSVVTDTIGVETQRADKLGHDIPFLYYLGPEIAVSHVAYPGFEAFGRIHHRSGGFGTIAEIDGSNAVVLGLRLKY